MPALRPGVADVSPFLVAHVTSLRRRAEEGITANAAFADAGAQTLLGQIRSCDDNAFLAAAGALGERLIEEMAHVGRAAPGLLLCTTIAGDDPQEPSDAAVLKLEVVAEVGAVLRVLDRIETLATVIDVQPARGSRKASCSRTTAPGAPRSWATSPA